MKTINWIYQHLHRLTPTEAWRGIDSYKAAPKALWRFAGWEGLLRGFCLRR